MRCGVGARRATKSEFGCNAHLTQDIISNTEGFLQRSTLLDNVQQSVIGDDDHRVHVRAQLLDSAIRLPHPSRAFEGEGLGHHTNGETACLRA